ncbi:MAG: hypothetical protein ABJD53_10060 [Gammaproteobacteria bacterium]
MRMLNGRLLYLAPFAVAALKDWVGDAGIDAEFLFRAVLPAGTIAEKPAHTVDKSGKAPPQGLSFLAGGREYPDFPVFFACAR